MVDYARRPGEDDPNVYRARILQDVADEKAGIGAGPSADQQVQAKKDAIHKENEKRAQARMRDPNHATNRLDNAVEQANVEEKHRDIRRHGDVKPIDKKAADAAYNADAAFKSMKPEQQAAAARAKPAPAHTTSTPGAAHQTSMAAAMTAAGVPETPKTERRVGTTPDAATSARNNMGTPRGGDRGSAVAGVASRDSSSDLAAARAAATKGTRGSGNKRAEADAARQSSRRSAASASPAPAVTGSQFTRVGDSGAELSSAPGRDWVTPSQIRGGLSAPAPSPAQMPQATANPSPVAPVPSAPGPHETGGNTPRGPLTNVIGRGIAEKGSNVSPGHMVSSAPGRDWLTPQAANKANKAKAARTPAVASVEPITPAAKPETPQATPRTIQTPSWSAPERPAPAVTPSPAPSRMPTPQNTPLSSQMSAPAPEAPKARRAPTPVVSSPAPEAPSRGPVATAPAPSATSGRSTATTLRSPEVGGGRGGLHQGGEHNVNVGGDNYGQITHNHNTYNVNHGVNNGSMGNVDHGYSPRGSAGGPGGSGGSRGRGPGGVAQHEAHEAHTDLWVRDVNGTHSLHKGIQHVTGQTGGHGEKMATTRHGASGGTQRPMRGSSRAPSGTPVPTTSTGTTHNWQGPQTTQQLPASGNGTAQPVHPTTTP